jgi:DMSO reductase anchor subunit
MEWLFGGGFLLFFVLWGASIGVWIWMLVDAIRVPDESIYRSGNKLTWVLVIVLAGIIGAIIYLAAGRPRRGSKPITAGSQYHQPGLPPPPPPI